MKLARIKELRTELEAERISWGELAEISDAYEQIRPDRLLDVDDPPMASNMLDELETVTYGACGQPYCDRCLPRFDADNNRITDTKEDEGHGN